MRKTLIVVAVGAIAAFSLSAPTSAAFAGPCSPEIIRIQELVDARIHAKAGPATALESIGELHHQPTPSSVASAEAELGRLSPEELTAVNAAMARAVEADGASDRSGCEQALADAERLLGSAGTQTNNARR